MVGRLLGAFDHALDLLHDKVLRPLILAGRTVAFGFLILLVGLFVLVALLIVSVRLLDVYAFPGVQWVSYLVLGGLFVTVGLVIWRQRRPVHLRK